VVAAPGEIPGEITMMGKLFTGAII